MREGDDREYLYGKKDIHESSLDLQRTVRQVYLDAAEVEERFFIVDCSDSEGGMATADVIFERLRGVVEPLLD